MPATHDTSVEPAGRWRWARVVLILLTSLPGLRAQTAGSPPPVLSADVNGARQVEVFSGWPLLLRVRLTHPQLLDSGATPITLASDAGTWTSRLHLDIRNTNGTEVSWPLTFLNAPAGTLLLDASSLGELHWALSPLQTMALAPGEFTVSVTWDSRTVTHPVAWKGLVRAVPVDVRVRSEPAPLTATQYEHKQRALAEYHLALGNTSEALSQINALLQSDSNSIGGWVYRGAMLRRVGRYEEALASVHLAMAKVQERYPDANEPPRHLLAQQSELTQLLLPGRLNSVRATNGGVVLDWNAIAGEVYRVESSRDFTNWTIHATGLLAETNGLSWVTNRLQDREFFRIGQ